MLYAIKTNYQEDLINFMELSSHIITMVGARKEIFLEMFKSQTNKLNSYSKFNNNYISYDYCLYQLKYP